MFWDPHPALYYRQHGGNVIGAGRGVFQGGRRIYRMLRGDYRNWVDKNIALLEKMQVCLTHKNRKILSDVIRLRGQRSCERMQELHRLPLKREGRLGDLALWGVVALSKF